MVDYQLSESFNYDKMGNITYLTRFSAEDVIDQLYLNYNGNQLKYVDDNGIQQNIYGLKEYQNKSNTQDEFSYDANGNMVKDLDRDIVTIKYNLLNLPEYVQFKNGNVIKNNYNAGGQKLSSDYYTRLTAITPLADGQILEPNYTSTNYNYTGTAYLGTNEYKVSKIYNSNYGGYYINKYTFDKLYTPEGYVTGSVIVDENNYRDGIQYCYFRKDHLGNNREVWRAVYSNYSGLQPATTIQRTQYYPSGLPWAEGLNSWTQNKKYNGKEFVEVHGLDETDLRNRVLYHATNRFTSIDRFCEKSFWQSPYVFAANNPVNYVDIDGDSSIIWVKDVEGSHNIYKYAKSLPDTKNAYDVFVHANYTHLLKYANKNDKNGINIFSGGTFINEMEKSAAGFKDAVKNDKVIYIKLHACNTGVDEYHGKTVLSIAKKISKALPNVIIIAPDGKVIIDSEGELGIYKKDGTGSYRYFKAGEEVKKDESVSLNEGQTRYDGKPEEYKNWGQIRRWFYDEFGF